MPTDFFFFLNLLLCNRKTSCNLFQRLYFIYNIIQTVDRNWNKYPRTYNYAILVYIYIYDVSVFSPR